MSDTSSSTTPQRSPRVRRCRKTTSRTCKSSGRKGQAKRFSSCGVVRMPSMVIPKPSLSSPEDLEVDSILQSSSSDDDRNVSSSISSDNEEDEEKNNHSRYRPTHKLYSHNMSTKYTKMNSSTNIHFVNISDNSMNKDANSDKVLTPSHNVLIQDQIVNSPKDFIARISTNFKSPITNRLKEARRVSSESSGTTSSSITKISNLERLIRIHPVWFQPDLNRDDTTVLLQGKEDGTFIVRKSSQPNTMALSVRLPKKLNFDKQSLQGSKEETNIPISSAESKQDFVQHYLIEQHQTDANLNKNDNSSNNSNDKSKLKMKLESSLNSFDNILSLVYHYLTVSEELPVLLTLPKILKDADSRQTLSSLALLGKDFWRYPMSFFQYEENFGDSHLSSRVASEYSSSPIHVIPYRPNEDKVNSIKTLESDSKLVNTSASAVKIEVNPHTPIRDSKEVSSLINDTILGLEEVGDLLQASLKEIENERVFSDVPVNPKNRPISRVLQENNIFLSEADREKSQQIILGKEQTTNDVMSGAELTDQYVTQKGYKQTVSNIRFPISKDTRSFVPSATKSTYNKVNIVKQTNTSQAIIPNTNHPSVAVPPTPPIRTTSSRQSSPALSPGRERKQISIQETDRPVPQTAAAALLHEIRNSVTSPTPFVISSDVLKNQSIPQPTTIFAQPCLSDNTSQLVNQSWNVGGGRKLSARQSFNKTSLKIVQDCKHPQSTSPTPTGSPTVSPQPQPGNIQLPFPNMFVTRNEYFTSPHGTGRKHSSPPILFTSTSTSISPNGNYTNGMDESYCRSSILDKMSDYEDIWNDTLPTSKNSMQRPDRSITPAESEQHFKAYLASKLLSSPSDTPSINNLSSNSFDAEKSRSKSSSGSSSNTNKSKTSSTSNSSTLSSTVISNPSPRSRIRKSSYSGHIIDINKTPPHVPKRSISISSEVSPIMHRPKLMNSNIPTVNISSSVRELQIKNCGPYNAESRQSVIHSKVSSANFYKITETMSTLASSTSDSVTSDLEITKQNGLEVDDDNKYNDPLYSDPLDALEKENDTRIYSSPDLKEQDNCNENIYEEASHKKTNQESKILHPLIESDHESSDSCSSSSSMSSVAMDQHRRRKDKNAHQRRRRSSLENSLTNLSQFEKLFTDDNSNVLENSKEDVEATIPCIENKDPKNYTRSHSLSMENLNQDFVPNDVGTPLSQVRKTSVSSYEGKSSKKKRKSSVSGISIRKREKTSGTSQSGNRASNRLSAVIGKYIRPASVVNQLEVSKATTWQLDSSSWEFLGQNEDRKEIKIKGATESNVFIGFNPLTSEKMQCKDFINEKEYNLQTGSIIEQEEIGKCIGKNTSPTDTETRNKETLGNQLCSSKKEAFMETNTASKTSSQFMENRNECTFNGTNRSGSSSPYDNLFLESSSTKQESMPNKEQDENRVFIKNLRNDKQISPAFNKYRNIKETERSQPGNRNNDEYTSDDSLYQSEENQSSCSIGSMSPFRQNRIIQNKVPPIKDNFLNVREKRIRTQEKNEREIKPRIELAIRRSTASIIESRLSPPSTSAPVCSICPIHDQSDFIDYPTPSMQSVVSTLSSTLSSQHINASKKRIQGYIRQLNQSTVIQNGFSSSPSEENQENTLDCALNEDLKCNGLLLQVIDNFVSCTIASIGRRITELKKSNESRAEQHHKNIEGNKYNSIPEDRSYTCEMIEVMKNVRQFISGVKNYLIKTGEGELHSIMQEERSKLQWDECLNLDTILEEVLQQLIIPGLRTSIVELCIAEQTKNSNINQNQPTGLFNTTVSRLDEIERLLISKLPKHLQDVLKSCSLKDKDIFSSTLKELDSFLHVNITSNKIESKGTSSPLEEIECLSNIVRSIIEEIKSHKAYVMDSNTKVSNSMGSPKARVEKDAIGNMKGTQSSKCEVFGTKSCDVFQENEKCLCSNEEMTLDSFCLLLCLAIIKLSMKNDDRLDEENQLPPNEIVFKCLEIETELMWHVIPKNMLNGEQAFFLSLFSTSCALLNTMSMSIKEDCVISNTSLQSSKILTKANTDDVNPRNETKTMATREFLPLTSDSETDSSKDVKSGNILTSCVGRRSKRRKKKKVSEKKYDEKTIAKPQNINEETRNTQINSDNMNNKTVEKLEKSIIDEPHEESVAICKNVDSHGIKDSLSNDHSLLNVAMINDNGMVTTHKTVQEVKLIFVKVLIPNEQSGSISASFIPVINKSHHVGMGTRVRDVMAVISFKQKVVNPHEYAVYLLSFESKEEAAPKQEQSLQSSDSSKTVPITKLLEDVFHERQLLDSELIADVLWSMKNMEPTLNLTGKYCNSPEIMMKEDDKAFTAAQQNGLSLNPLSNFLVYKRKDAKIAWPSAVSLLCNK